MLLTRPGVEKAISCQDKMKTAKTSTVRRVRFIPLFVSVSCIAVLASGIARADPLPPAFTRLNNGPAVFGPQSLATHLSGDGWQSVANVNASFGRIDASSYASAIGFYDNVQAGASGAATYYISITPVKGIPLAEVPVSIETHGRGSVDEGGWGSFSVSTWLSQFGYVGNIGSGLTAGPYVQSFDVTKTYWLPLDHYYEVDIGAGAGAFAFPGMISKASAYVDPIISFDQAAFDAAYPSSGINLSDYYELDYSANMVPEPASILVLVLAAAGLLLAGWASQPPRV